MDFSNPVNILIYSIYTIAVATLTFFSLFGIFILIRNGQNRILSFTISILYIVLYLILLSSSYALLRSY